MTDLLSDDVPQDVPGGETLGVMDALRMGWQILQTDFWQRWLMVFVATVILMGAGMILGIIPYLGICCQWLLAIFVQPPMIAGIVFAVTRCIDGAPADVGSVFEGYRQRYWQSVVSVLVPNLCQIGLALIAGGVIAAVVIVAEEGDEELAGILGVSLGIVVFLLAISVLVFSLFFMFALVCVWDYAESGWEAAKASMRLVKQHFWSTVGFAIMAWLIGLAAAIVGFIGLCVGILFTVPVASLWLTASMIYLFRSWTGQPLVQPIAVEPPAEGAGPVPPTDVLPPGV